MPTTEGVFDDFVRARWEDLEPAARVVVLDPGVAREVTAGALAGLRTRWAGVVEEGRPADEARRLVLVGALARSPVDGLAPVLATAPDGDPRAPDEAAPWGAEEDGVVTALVDHLRGLEPLDRALVAARRVWGAGPEDVARWLDRAAPALAQRAEVVDRGLEEAHTTAREREGAVPAPWALERDLARAVDTLLGGLTDPPDPAALVEARVRRVRRRGLVLGAVAAAATAGGIVAVVASREQPTSAAVAHPALPAPTDRVWASTSSWPPRGPLAADPAVPLFVERRGAPGDRVLWVGDLGSRRLVVAWTVPDEEFGEFGRGSTGIRIYTGPRGADLLTLDHLDPAPMMMPAVDCVAVVLADGPDAGTAPGSLLLVLGRPTVSRASYSPVARPTASGDLRRDWSDVALDDGVGALLLDQPVPTLLRVRLDGYEGESLTPRSVMDDVGPGPPQHWVETFVASLTGIPRGRLRTTVTSDDPVESGLFVDRPVVDGGDTARVLALRTTTPEGAVLRSLFVLEGEDASWPLELAALVPAEAADQPHVTRVSDAGPGVSRFLVLHPGADTVQLLAADADGRPASRVVRSGGRRATPVSVADGDMVPEFRVVLRDRRGRTVFDGVPVPSRSLFDS